MEKKTTSNLTAEETNLFYSILRDPESEVYARIRTKGIEKSVTKEVFEAIFKGIKNCFTEESFKTLNKKSLKRQKM